MINELFGEEMTSVYLLFHVHQLSDEGEADEKLLGVYSTREIVEKRIEEKYRNLPGFSEASGEYIIDEYQIDQDHWEEGFITADSDENGTNQTIDFFSLNNRYKVSIRKGNDGNYRVTTYEWTHFEGYSDEWLHYWEEIYGPSITDTEETAKSLAMGEFKRLTGEIGFKTDWIEPEKPEIHG